MFKRIFKKRNHDTLSKVDYWNKWELYELFKDLYRAEKILINNDNYKKEDNFLKFKDEFIEELHEIEGDNVADFTRIWKWFAPTKESDTFYGQNGNELGNNIFRITDKWKRNQDFENGTKVLLNNEFGVVLDKTGENEMYGQIRWDTNKENDIEDWRGLFGTFLQTGGEIISQEYRFKYINNDGTTKKASR